MDRKTVQSWLPNYIKFREGRGSDKQNTSENNIFGGSIAGKLKISGTRWCFSSLGHEFGHDNIEALFFQVQDWSPYCSEEAALHYFEWLFNLSPLRSIFFTKNIRRVERDKVVVIDPDADAGLIGVGTIAMRMTWENHGENNWQIPSRIETWWEMVDSGIDPKEAFLVAHTFGPSTEDSVKTELTTLTNLGHLPMGDDDATFRNFINEEPRKAGSFRRVKNHRPFDNRTNSVFGDYRGDGTHDIINAFREKMNEIAGEVVNNNPFVRMDTSYISREQLVEAGSDFTSIIHERIANG